MVRSDEAGNERTVHAKVGRFRFTVLGALGLVVAIALALGLLVRIMRHPINRASCHRNLAIIGVALGNYHASYGCYPPAYLTDDQGAAMHSWRVLLLPFLEEQSLYQTYDFSEPWNGPRNLRLVSQCPEVYLCPADRRRPNMTSYVAVTGSGTVWPGRTSVKKSEIGDGVTETIAIVESAKRNVVWCQPSDIDYEEVSLTDFGGNHPSGFYTGMADGSVMWIPETTPIEILRGMLTTNGREPVPGKGSFSKTIEGRN